MKCKKKETQLDKLIVDNKHTGHVRSFGYFGTIVNGNNSLEQEIIERTAKVNKVFYGNKTSFFKVIYFPGNPN